MGANALCPLFESSVDLYGLGPPLAQVLRPGIRRSPSRRFQGDLVLRRQALWKRRRKRLNGLRDRNGEGDRFWRQRVEKSGSRTGLRDSGARAEKSWNHPFEPSISGRSGKSGRAMATAVASGLLPESVFGSFSRCPQVHKLLSSHSCPAKAFG